MIQLSPVPPPDGTIMGLTCGNVQLDNSISVDEASRDVITFEFHGTSLVNGRDLAMHIWRQVQEYRRRNGGRGGIA